MCPANVVRAFVPLENQILIGVPTGHCQCDVRIRCDGRAQRGQVHLPEAGRRGLVERIDEDHEPAAGCRGGFACGIHRAQQNVFPDWLQAELIGDACPQVALSQLGTCQEDRGPTSIERALGGVEQQVRFTRSA